MAYVPAVLFLIAGCFGAIPSPYQNRTVSWILVALAGFFTLLPLH